MHKNGSAQGAWPMTVGYCGGFTPNLLYTAHYVQKFLTSDAHWMRPPQDVIVKVKAMMTSSKHVLYYMGSPCIIVNCVL